MTTLGLEDAWREDLNMSLMDKLDAQVLVPVRILNRCRQRAGAGLPRHERERRIGGLRRPRRGRHLRRGRGAGGPRCRRQVRRR